MKSSTLLFFFALCLNSCFNNQSSIAKTFSTDKLREDLSVMKGIITRAHAGAYAYNTPAQLNALFDSVSQSVNGPLTMREFYNKIDIINERLKCVHSRTILPDEYYDSIYKKNFFFPIPLIDIDDKLYINSTAYTIPLGAEILTINETGSKDIIKQLGNYYHVDGYGSMAKSCVVDEGFSFYYYLAYGPSASFIITYKQKGKDDVKTFNLNATSMKMVEDDLYADTYYFFPGDAKYDLEIKDETKTAILTLRSFFFDTYSTSTAFSHFVANSFRLIRQNKIKNLVIDCRNNTGGYYKNVYPLLSYLVNKNLPEYDSAIRRFYQLPFPEYVDVSDTGRIVDLDTTAYKFSEIRKGVYAQKTDDIEKWGPNDYVYKGKLFLIVNGNTMSAASTFAAVLKDKTNVLVVGEETRGGYEAHNADVLTYVLPNSRIKIDVPLLRYYQPVVNKSYRQGVVPDHDVPYTVAEMVSNTDKQLDYIFDSVILR